MILPDGYSDVPPGKIVSVVTSLEMRAEPAPMPEPAPVEWTLRRVPVPEVEWYRDLYRRIGEDWLWFSRLAMPRTELEGILRHPAIEVHALVHDGRDEGLIELDFRAPEGCELTFFGVTGALLGKGAGRWM